MGFPDRLLTATDAGHRSPAPDDTDASDACPVCGSPPLPTDVCPSCDPACAVERSPVRASFALDTATGAVTEVAL